MPMRLMLVLAAVVAALGVSASFAPAGAGLFGPDWEDDRGVAEACFRKISDDPAMNPINGKLARRGPTLAQLADESLASDAEIQLLQQRSVMEQPCREMMYKAVREHHPWFESAYQIRFFQTDMVYLHLLKKRITYGDANRLMNESYLEFSAREDQYFQARSDEQRRAIAESMGRIARQTQSAPPPPPGSGRLTCRWIGPTLYCDPY